MSITAFDTLEFTETLIQAGVPDKQAKAEAVAVSKAFSQALDTQVATKADIHRLERGQDALTAKINLLKWMLGFNLGFSIAMLPLLIAIIWNLVEFTQAIQP